MQPIRIFASFDPLRDADLYQRLMSESRSSDSPFEIADASGSEGGSQPLEARAGLAARMGRVDVVIVLCGEQTASSVGVSLELRTAQELGKPYLMVWGRREKTCTRPVGAKPDDSMYTWIWSVLKSRIGFELRKSAPSGSPA